MDGFSYRPGSRRALSRRVGNFWVQLIEHSPIDHPDDARVVLVALGIEPTEKNLGEYFPTCARGYMRPTTALIDRFYDLISSHGGSHVGV